MNINEEEREHCFLWKASSQTILFRPLKARMKSSLQELQRQLQRAGEMNKQECSIEFKAASTPSMASQPELY